MAQTVASNPANVRVNLTHFLKCDGKDLIVLVGSLLLGSALLAVNWKAALIVAGIGVFVALFSIYQAKDLFANGNVCPAVVLDPQRQLIAVMTDLSQGRSPKPALKVQKAPLRRAGRSLRRHLCQQHLRCPAAGHLPQPATDDRPVRRSRFNDLFHLGLNHV